MRKILIFSIGLVLMVITGSKGFAQGCETPSDDSDGVKLFGFFQPQYEYHLTDPANSTFKFKRARIGFMGNVPYDFSYYVVLENSAFVSQTGNPYLLDAFITYKRFKWATVSVGSFKQPFGLEVNTSCSGLTTVERAMVSDQIVAPQRDMGVMLLGGDNTTMLKYSLALMNGRGLGVKDNNNKKDIIGRLVLQPIEMISIGGSFRYGFPNNEIDNRVSVAAEMQFKTGPFTLQGEYIHDQGDYNRAAGGGCGSDPVTLGEKRDGAWVMASYMTKLRLEPVFKWEYFDADKDLVNNEMYVMTGGVNYFFNDWTRLQVNYQYRAEKGAELPNDAVLVQLQVKF